MMAAQQRRQPPELTKDQLNQMDQKLKSEGKDTSNLDKMISNFDKLDTDGNGKVSMNELKTNASQYGINLPQGGGHHRGHHGGPKPAQDGDSDTQAANSWGPPPGLLTNDPTSSVKDPDGDGDGPSASGGASGFDPNAFMLSMMEKFTGSNPPSGDSSATASSSVNIAA